MTAFALKGILGRKLRTILTAFAIVLGVATVSGTYVLTDSIDKAFDTIFTEARQGSDAVITGKSAFDLTSDSGVTAPSFDESLLEKLVCPVTRTPLRYDRHAQELISDAAALAFPIRDGTSVMLTDEARRLDGEPAQQ